MRDNRKPKSHFDELLAIQDQYFHSVDQIATFQRVNEASASEVREFGALTSLYCREFAADIPLMYSRGDSMAEIYEKRGADLGRRYATTAAEIVDQGYSQQNFFNINLSDPHGIHQAYSILCWLICFGTSEEDMQIIAPEFAPAGKDRIVDLVLGRYQSGRNIAIGSGHSPTFQLLDDLVDADSATRITIIKKYMKSWGKLLSNLNGLGSVGIFRKRKLTNKTLDKDVGGAYKGFWMWEVALAVKFFGIDDSSFLNDEFYPAELVHFKR
jgi:hypothetical protein